MVAAVIAWRQYQNARAKLRLDLFERRFRVYRGLMDLLAAVVQEASVPNDALARFYKETNEKAFLFDSNITTYLDEIRHNVVAVRQAQRKITALQESSEMARLAACDTDTGLLAWFDDQINQAQIRFSKYLSFKKNL